MLLMSMLVETDSNWSRTGMQQGEAGTRYRDVSLIWSWQCRRDIKQVVNCQTETCTSIHLDWTPSSSGLLIDLIGRSENASPARLCCRNGQSRVISWDNDLLPCWWLILRDNSPRVGAVPWALANLFLLKFHANFFQIAKQLNFHFCAPAMWDLD